MDSVVDGFLNTSMRYMMNTATAAVVEEKMEPITSAPVTQQLVVTGQYLYDTFVVSDEQQITKMGIIRRLSDTADALQIKGACDKMVEAAVLVDYPTGKPKKAERKAKEQSAMNARTIIQQAWGALKHCRATLDELGYDDKTGYQDMRVLAKSALDKAKIKWSGEAQPTEKEKEVARLKRDQKAETDALVDVQKENPRTVGESLMDWNTRTFALAQTAMEKARADKTAEVVRTVVGSLVEKYDENTLFQIAEALMDACGVEVTDSIEQEETEQESETS